MRWLPRGVRLRRNIEWFGSSSNGPTNESLQLSNARDVIKGADLDIWGLEEVVSTTSFNSLKSQLSSAPA
ncbi:hypothetical protein [Cystobacter ferrugineus]|uniref:Uncharacterized protein n=1 Tax=Cystobacter ferrugineus TaxID=83449 RepID=A0A1L9BBC6_9BACT|nr:hypothetical protein [Cystobacter ferrugineus]OJH39549.1 hypothetical protein BON30_18820 [Cystobacter ferrugineus]